MTDTVPVVHPVAEAPAFHLGAPDAGSGYEMSRSLSPTRPYLVDIPGRGIVRLSRVFISDYRRGREERDRVEKVHITYYLHPQTKTLKDHRGRNAEAVQMYAKGQRRLTTPVLEDRIADTVLAVVRELDKAKDAAETEERRRAEQREDLTSRARALGVDLEWRQNGRPVVTADLIELVLRAAETQP